MKKNQKDKVTLLTLGCAKNVVDSENLIGQLKANGFQVVDNLKDASVCIVNTCGFIKPAVEENLSVVLELVNLKLSGKIQKLIVSGCMVQRFDKELKEEFPEVDLFVGVERQAEIIRYLKGNDDDLKNQLLGERYLLTPKHYAYLKISEGCNRECSFCAIPNIRGKLHSRPIENIVQEAVKLANRGVKELILISQDTSAYGVDLYGKVKLIDLLEELTKIDGIRWIRLMYLYPAGLPDELFDFVADNEKICNYFDIPLQHISDKVLKLMRRGTTEKYIRNLIEKIRVRNPEAIIRSTFIVGFPNEDEKDFANLLDFVEKFELDRIGVFTYSQEDGTSAFPLGDPIPEDEKIRRRNLLMELQKEISWKKNKEKIGSDLLVLVDQKQGKTFLGRTEFDAPEVDNLVYISPQNSSISVGNFIKVKIKRAKEYDLFGEALKV